MATILSAHGYDPGPSQRPLLAGAISGVIATAPAVMILVSFGSLKTEAVILRLSAIGTLGLGCLVMTVAGAIYARLFGRAANSVHGGWLFGMVFGFALWATGAVLVLPLVGGGEAPGGEPALGVALSMLVWGFAIGALLPFVHRPLHQSIDKASRLSELGPAAATGNNRPIHSQRAKQSDD